MGVNGRYFSANCGTVDVAALKRSLLAGSSSADTYVLGSFVALIKSTAAHYFVPRPKSSAAHLLLTLLLHRTVSSLFPTLFVGLEVLASYIPSVDVVCIVSSMLSMFFRFQYIRMGGIVSIVFCVHVLADTHVFFYPADGSFHRVSIMQSR